MMILGNVPVLIGLTSLKVYFYPVMEKDVMILLLKME